MDQQKIKGSDPFIRNIIPIFALALIILSQASLSGFSQTVKDDFTEMNKYLNIQYSQIEGVNPKLLSLDIYSPKDASNCPIIIMIHGGGWKGGDKTGTGVVNPKSQFFISKGYIFVSVNYRLSPAVKHPTHVQDVAKAIAWVHSNIKQYGGNPERIFVMGHSAGAHLAALVSVDERYLEANGKSLQIIKGTIPLDGVYFFVKRDIGERISPRSMRMLDDAFGDDPKVRADAEPINHVDANKGIPPFLIFYTDHIPFAKLQVTTLVEKLKKAGVDAEAVHTPDRRHGSLNTNIGKPNDKYSKMIMEFIENIK